MSDPLILWFRRDLRLDDNPMLAAAAATGRPLVPVFIGDDSVLSLGAAAKWRMGEGIAAFARRLTDRGGRLILRRGGAGAVLDDLIVQTGATGVWWTRLYDPFARERDSAIKDALKARGIDARSFDGHTLIEPWQVETGAGSFFRVYTPFWKALSARGVAGPVAEPRHLVFGSKWPASEDLADWAMGAAMNRGARVLAKYAVVGEVAAQKRLERFLARAVETYRHDRDFPGLDAVSGLSENLTYGEIGARRVWAAAMSFEEVNPGHKGAEHFRKELAWRDFAHHLMFHTPEILTRNWRPEWDSFPWSQDDDARALRWKQGLTGERFVDAGMRQMYVTGTMHNRARMIVASYLTKHLMIHWKIGLDWFADCLTDWDPASNAMGWQWTAGSGPDAAPYFRIFNPETQLEKFDADQGYRRRYIAELSRDPAEPACDFFDAVPRSWGLDPARPYPRPMVDLAVGREQALAAYGAREKPGIGA